MREGWEYKKLGECTQILDSQRKPVTKKDRKEGVYPYYGATGIQDYVDKYIFEGRYVLVGEDGAKWGAFDKSAFIIDGKTWVNNHAHVLKPFEPLVDSYLTYYLNHSDLNGFISGAIVRKLTQSSLKNIKIPLPPKSTQLAIVSELDKINELIRLKKEQLKDFDNLAQSLFYEMFGDPVENEKGWEVKKLNNICDVRDGTHDSPKYLQNSEYILITSKNIVNGSIDFENVNYISEEDYIKINKRSKVDNGDIIMPMIGTIGNPIIAHIDGTHKFCIKNVALIKFLADSTVNNMFIVNLMRCSSFSSYLLNQNKGGTQKFVALGAIRKLPIPLPPLPLQHLFAQRIEQIEHQKSEVQKAITDLETLLASRMQYWFE